MDPNEPATLQQDKQWSQTHDDVIAHDSSWSKGRLLFEVCQHGDTSALEILLKHDGVDLNYVHETIVWEPESTGKTPLIVAVNYSHAKIVKMLIGAGVDVNFGSKCKIDSDSDREIEIKYQAMSQAVFSTLEISKMLLDAGADVFDNVGNSDTCAMSIAVYYHIEDYVQQYLDAGVNVNQTISNDCSEWYNFKLNGRSLLGRSCMGAGDDSDIVWKFQHMLCVKYGAQFNNYELESDIAIGFIDEFIDEYVNPNIQMNYGDGDNVDIKLMMDEMLMSVLREGIYLHGEYSSHDCRRQETFLEKCLCRGITHYAKFFWISGSKRNSAAAWNRINMQFVLRDEEYGSCGPCKGEKEETLKFLEDVVLQPRTLLDCSRGAVRHYLHAGHMSDKVKKLEIPKTLKEYLMLPELSELVKNRPAFCRCDQCKNSFSDL